MLKSLFGLAAVAAISLGALNPCLAEDEIYDPWEGFNRGIFWFNDTLDIYVAEPVARAYDDVLPQPVKRGVSNFFENLSYPKYLASDLIQLKFGQAAKHTGRFGINTILGIGGLIDVAQGMGLPHQEQDIGVAFAYHGIPAGPYLVLPFLGPSTVRDAIGRGIEVFLSPWYWIAAESNLSSDERWAIGGSLAVLEFIDARYHLLEGVEAAKDSSLDYYLFTQSAYYQYRAGLLTQDRGGKDDAWLQGTDEDSWLKEGED